jgi:hemerythrin-like metal-binding protein
MIRWDPSLAIGVPEIDDQHQALFEYAARLEGAVHAGHFNYRVEEIFSFLSAYAAKHFEAEERLMRETAYPALAQQVREHRDFQRRLSALVPQWDTEGASADLVIALLGLLDFWLTDHIKSSDRGIADHLRVHAPERVRG